VRVEFVKESLVFTGEDSPMANLMLSVMGAFAEFERSLIWERQREGITLAKQRGAYRGRKKTLTPERAELSSGPVPAAMVSAWCAAFSAPDRQRASTTQVTPARAAIMRFLCKNLALVGAVPGAARRASGRWRG
jgi:hypothetical protein